MILLYGPYYILLIHNLQSATSLKEKKQFTITQRFEKNLFMYGHFQFRDTARKYTTNTTKYIFMLTFPRRRQGKRPAWIMKRHLGQYA